MGNKAGHPATANGGTDMSEQATKTLTIQGREYTVENEDREGYGSVTYSADLRGKRGAQLAYFEYAAQGCCYAFWLLVNRKRQAGKHIVAEGYL